MHQESNYNFCRKPQRTSRARGEYERTHAQVEVSRRRLQHPQAQISRQRSVLEAARVYSRLTTASNSHVEQQRILSRPSRLESRHLGKHTVG